MRERNTDNDDARQGARLTSAAPALSPAPVSGVRCGAGSQPLISSSECDYIRMMNVAVSPGEGLGAHVKEQGQTRHG